MKPGWDMVCAVICRTELPDMGNRSPHLPSRPKLDDSIRIAVAPDDTRRIFAAAAERRVTVSELVRDALASTVASVNQQAV